MLCAVFVEIYESNKMQLYRNPKINNLNVDTKTDPTNYNSKLLCISLLHTNKDLIPLYLVLHEKVSHNTNNMIPRTVTFKVCANQ